MTGRRQLEQQRDGLVEIRGIMNAMKNLAYMETRKLDRFVDAQDAVVNGIETVAADFVSAFPYAVPRLRPAACVYLLVGSERGFCGDFNEALVRKLEDEPALQPGADAAVVIATGRKLHPLLHHDARVVAFRDGANVVEEVATMLTGVVDTLAELQTARRTLELYVLYHDETAQAVVKQQLLPPFQTDGTSAPAHAYPPDLNVPPPDFLIELSDQYLFAALLHIFYVSLMAENRRRVQHLEAAVQHLDERAADLGRRCNALRQEEIVEEIEVILLNIAKTGTKTA